MITLSSMFSKLLDFMKVNKEDHQLNTSELQFSFKKDSSTNLCTSILRKEFVILQLYWWLFSSTQHCS